MLAVNVTDAMATLMIYFGDDLKIDDIDRYT